MASVKSRLAQLLAQEDIRVQHLPTKTAYFDMQNRVLTCPIWKDMDGDLYDLCMGHEVGHALNTPAEGWHGALVQMGKGYQSYMNVVEDARIERKIKAKFPGLRAPFARAYIKLDQRDIFNIRGRKLNVNKLGLIDRLNIHFKMGHIYDVRFTAEERGFIERIERAETWGDVRQIADELYARAKKNKDKLPETGEEGMPQNAEQEQGQDSEDQQEQKSKKAKPSKDKKDQKSKDEKKDKKSKPEKKNEEDMTDEELAEAMDNANAGERPEDDENEYDDEDEGSSGESDSDEDGDEDSDEEDDADGDGNETGDADGDDSEEDEESDDEVDGLKDDHDAEDKDQQGTDRKDFVHNLESDLLPEVPDPVSLTDEAFRAAEEQLVDKYASGIRTLYLPDTKDVDSMIAPVDLIYTSIEDGIRSSFDEAQRIYGAKKSFEEFSALSVQEIMQENKKYVDLLVKEFELRKNASAYARQLVAKTGELDVNRLHQYKFTNDLFRKVTTVQKGKSHGMVFFLDMSSSMQSIMGYTVKQLLVLVMFCKRVGVPFDVYGFADGGITGFRPGRFNWTDETIQCSDKHFHLKHLLSSNLRGNQFRRAYAAMAMYSNIFYDQQSEQIHKYLTTDVGGYGISFSEHRLNMILNGTPYNKMLLASRDIIEKFRNKHQVDIVNVIHLTDGEGTDHCHAPYPKMDWNNPDPNYDKLQGARIAYTDRKTHISHLANRHESSQQVLTDLVKKITGCRHLAFYVGSLSTIRGYVSITIEDHNARVLARRSIEQNGFFMTPHLGYDSYYYMVVDAAGKQVQISNNENIDITDRFVAAQRAKGKMRNMARQFASELAEQIKRD